MRKEFTFCLAVIVAVMCCGQFGCQPNQQAQQALVAGEQAFSAKDYDNAIAQASQSIGYDANNADAYYLRGRAMEERPKPDTAGAANDLALAKADYQKGLTLNPSSAVAANLRAQLGNIAFNQNDYASAIAQWTQALPGLENDAIKARMMYLMGVSQQRLGRFSDADRTFAQVLLQYGDTPSAAQAKERQGLHGFQVQVGAYTLMADANRAAKVIQTTGAVAEITYEHGKYIVRSTPTPSYAQAEALRQRLLKNFGDAMVYP